MFALFSRILKLSGRYKSRIQGAFVCAFLESILSKMPIFLAFVVLSGFANKTITGQTCLYVGLGLAAIVLVQMLVHYLSDSLQSAAGYLMFADKRMELGGHLRKLPMGYFTSGNIGKISSVLSTDSPLTRFACAVSNFAESCAVRSASISSCFAVCSSVILFTPIFSASLFCVRSVITDIITETTHATSVIIISISIFLAPFKVI